jgi:cytochrome c heme-lyase
MPNSPIAITPATPPPSIPRAKAAECPIPHDQRALHPLNRIPLGLSATEKAPGQVLDLPTEREVSSIPRPQHVGDGEDLLPEDRHDGKWEYPSPQQFYNALVRKGWETPEESIEMVVAIHNFLNERAWEEVMAWEKRLPG